MTSESNRKKFLVTYQTKRTCSVEVEAETEDEAYDLAAEGFAGLETLIDEDYLKDVSCEEIPG